MPSGYAHYVFGEKVFESLDKELKNKIEADKELFYLGLHGPDIFFYYHPYFFMNKIMRYGLQMHKDRAIDFFDMSRKIARKQKCIEAGFSYLSGFMCHFILDSECHPYIREQVNLGIAEHFEMEAEFDRYLLYKEGKDPLTANITSHISRNRNYGMDVLMYFPFTAKQINASVHWMIRILRMLQAPVNWKRSSLKTLFHLTGHYKKLSGLLMPEEPNEACQGIDIELERRLVQSIHPTVLLIQEYYDKFYSDEELNHRLDRNYK